MAHKSQACTTTHTCAHMLPLHIQRMPHAAWRQPGCCTLRSLLAAAASVEGSEHVKTRAMSAAGLPEYDCPNDAQTVAGLADAHADADADAEPAAGDGCCELLATHSEACEAVQAQPQSSAAAVIAIDRKSHV